MADAGAGPPRSPAIMPLGVFKIPPRLTKPGLFITGTGTGVGKTVVACAIAWNLCQRGICVGVSKPIASGCRADREGLVNPDAEALAHFADCRQPLEVINPIRYAAPVAPAAAAERSGTIPDFEELKRALELVDASSDLVLVEGVGGLLVPIHPTEPTLTVLDLIRAVRYPVVVVLDAHLGTLNHTAMTVRLIRDAGCMLAGLIMNGCPSDAQRDHALEVDPSLATNRMWLERMNNTKVLTAVPQCPADLVAPQRGRLPRAILDALALDYWPDLAEVPAIG